MKTEYCCGAQCQQSLQLAMETRKIFPSERILDALPATWYTCNVALGCKKNKAQPPGLGLCGQLCSLHHLEKPKGRKMQNRIDSTKQVGYSLLAQEDRAGVNAVAKWMFALMPRMPNRRNEKLKLDQRHSLPTVTDVKKRTRTKEEYVWRLWWWTHREFELKHVLDCSENFQLRNLCCKIH